MIIKGSAHTGKGLSAYLMQDKNDRAEVLDIRGMRRDLAKAIADWRSDSQGTNCSKPLYHAQLNPDRELSRDEWETAISIFEKEMGLEQQPRAVVLHEYKGREHVHLVYSRIDEDGKAVSDSWNYLHHEKAAREIEQALGMEKTKGAFTEREGPRPERTPDRDAIQQGERLNLDPKAIKAEVSELYQSAETGRAFVEALEAEGYTLAQGDKRGLVILDQAGGVHSLTRMAGAKAGELRERLGDSALNLPTVDEVRAAQQEQAKEQTAPQIEAHGETDSDTEKERKTPGKAEAIPADWTIETAEIDTAPDLGEGLERGVVSVADAGLKLASKALDGIASSLEGALMFDSTPPPPPTQEQRDRAANQAEAEREARIDLATERLRQINEDYQKQQQEREQTKGLDQGLSLGLELRPK